jgi:DUF4097 and DUF4098 domain-containing protein YvlB
MSNSTTGGGPPGMCPACGPGGTVTSGLNGDADIYSVTGTVDYAITNNLMVRGEVRFDTISKDGNDDEFFDKHGNNLTDTQTSAGVEVVYEF